MKPLTFFRLNLLEFVFAGLFFVLIIFPKFTALYIGVMILTVVYSYIRKVIKFQFSFGTIAFALFYLAYLIGVLWTENEMQANFYIVNKLAFLLFPILLAIKKEAGFKLKIVLWGLILATLSSFLNGIFNGVPCYWEHHSIEYCFMRDYLSPHIHPTYMTVFAQMSIVSLFYLFGKKAVKRGVFYPFILLLIIYNLLLMSLSGILFLMFMIFAFIVWKAWHNINRLIVIVGVPAALICFFVIAPQLPILDDEIESSKQALSTYMASPDKFLEGISSYPSGSDVRLVMWTVSLDEIKKHPLGIGTGNVDIYLGENLRNRGLDEIASHEYNPHNQYLQTTLEIGIIGGVILLLIITFGFIDAVKLRSWVLFFLFASLFLNSLFESMLQHQAGIIFYPFFYMMLLIDFNSSKTKAE